MKNANKASKRFNRITTDLLIKGSKLSRSEPLSHLSGTKSGANDNWFNLEHKAGRLL